MADLLTFLPLFQETAASIRARMDADANAGLAPDDPRYTDTREGHFYYDVTQTALLDLARLWDALSVDVPAAAFPQFAWGPYIEYHAEKFGLARKAPVAATGSVTLVGDSGTVVPIGTVLSASPADPEDDDIEFLTTAEGTIGAALPAPAGLAATTDVAGGVLATDTYFYAVSALNEYGETEGSGEVEAVVTGPTARVMLDWPDVAGATGYRVYRRTDLIDGFRIAEVTTSAFIDTGAVFTGVEGPPEANSTAGVTVPVQAREPGADSNVAALAIENILTPNPALDAVVNRLPTAGGTDEETDAELQTRVIVMYQGAGGGNVNDYRRWAMAQPGVGRVFVNPVWRGPGTVQVVVMDAAGRPVASTVVADLQQALDPMPQGGGGGLAPIGAHVTVQTPASVSITVGATVVFEPGYNLDGTGGQIGVRSQIEESLSQYIGTLEVGEDVVYQHVLARFFRAAGVYRVDGLTVNGGTADIAVASDPPQVAVFGGATLAS